MLSNPQTNAQKVFSDIYEILKDQRSNGNPLSNMMNRNLRIFENIKNELKNAANNEVYKFEKEMSERFSKANR